MTRGEEIGMRLYAVRAGARLRRASAQSRTCHSCRPRESSRSCALDGRALSSGGACGRARIACRTARAKADSARRLRASVSQARQLRLQPLELLALAGHDLSRRLGDEALVAEL